MQLPQISREAAEAPEITTTQFGRGAGLWCFGRVSPDLAGRLQPGSAHFQRSSAVDRECLVLSSKTTRIKRWDVKLSIGSPCTDCKKRIMTLSHCKRS
jgi:hypothetical protein